MRILIQRVSHARVSVAGQIVGEIENSTNGARGLLAFVGIRTGDTAKTVEWMADKIANLRIFDDPEGKMNLSVYQVGGNVLAVSQFTLYGEVRKGTRPNFLDAAPPDEAEKMYELFLELLKARLGAEHVESGRFRAHMKVELTNEGPCTIMLERETQ